jgi:hypothetical protein
MVAVTCGGCKSGSQPLSTPVDVQKRDYWQSARTEGLSRKYDASLYESDVKAPGEFK